MPQPLLFRYAARSQPSISSVLTRQGRPFCGQRSFLTTTTWAMTMENQTSHTTKPAMNMRGRVSKRRGGGSGPGNRRQLGTKTDAKQAPAASKSFSQQASLAPQAPAVPQAQDQLKAVDKFEDLAQYNVHPNLINTITQDLKFERMTEVQAATFPTILSGKDILAQAKTGTGKTVAFLLPAIQKLISSKNTGRPSTSLLVISPTRELALQIAAEATSLLQHFPHYKVCTAIGGTNSDKEMKRILAGCSILVGTPGRLLDHLSNSPVQQSLQNLQTLVLDEADRLLDMGFLRDLTKLVSLLPNKETSKRQGMLFSATIASHVSQVASLVLSDGYKFISTIPKGEVPTHKRVPQNLVIVPEFSDMGAAVLGAIRYEMYSIGRDAFKAILFAPTSSMVDFYGAVLGSFSDLPAVSSLHSRMSQGKRTKITNEFRNAASGILVATDVVARGMDFPGVTNVLQAGLPMDRESYIHRLGRTARAGADGRGTLLLTSHEASFRNTALKEIDFETQEADLGASSDVHVIARNMDAEKHAKVYQGWLGYYKDQRKVMGWDIPELVRQANTFAIRGIGASAVPGLKKSVVGKMGLKGVQGLVVVQDPARYGRG